MILLLCIDGLRAVAGAENGVGPNSPIKVIAVPEDCDRPKNKDAWRLSPLGAERYWCSGIYSVPLIQ